MYLGLISLGSTLTMGFVTKDGSDIPTDATAGPSYRIYGPSGVMTNGTGTMSLKDTGSITGATNASPIEITSANHQLNTGTRVTISGVGGNTAANGTFNITNTGSNTFTLDGSTGNGTYTTGGTWHVSGLYNFSYAPTGGNGFASGTNYSVLVTHTTGGTTKADILTFTVV